MRHFRALIYSTRGVWLLLGQIALLYLKHAWDVKTELPLYIAGLSLAIAAQVYRTWAAGFVGTAARGQTAYGEALITAGPYGRVRNPMYLGNLAIMVAFCMMSGLWFSPFISLGAYAFVYSNVIPYEEGYLAVKFKDEYAKYRKSVPRLQPTLKAYPLSQGRFVLREGLANEVFAIPGLMIVAALYWLL